MKASMVIAPAIHAPTGKVPAFQAEIEKEDEMGARIAASTATEPAIVRRTMAEAVLEYENVRDWIAATPKLETIVRWTTAATEREPGWAALRTASAVKLPVAVRRSVAETVNALVEEERMTALAEVVAKRFARMIASDVADDRRVALTRALAANDPA
jgi:hypothetical protein